MRSHPSFLEGGTRKTKHCPFFIAIIYIFTVLTVHLSIILSYGFEGGKTIPSQKGFPRSVLEEPVEVSQFD